MVDPLSNETLTLFLEGEITLDLFSEVMSNFNTLVSNLTEEVTGTNDIEWQIALLESGSALTTVRGTNENLEGIARVVRAYESVARSLSEGKPIPYSDKVARPAYAITSRINGYMSAVRFSTAEESYQIEAPQEGREQPKSEMAFGSVTGEMVSIWSHPSLKIGLYDALFNRVVHCYFGRKESEQEERVREAWKHRVYVTGNVKRDAETGRPIEVRQVLDIEVVDRGHDNAFLEASGILPWIVGNETAEDTIRRIRNGID
jgi:hypothetical protein